jgi:hypothetical protein
VILKTLIFLSSYILIFLSCIGFGFLFLKLIKINNKKINLGIVGILGIFFLTFISYLTNVFIAHNYLHNIFLHSIGLSYFFFYFISNKINKKNFFQIFILLIFLISGLFLSKNNEDFPYYHLAFTLNLVESNVIIGLGNFNSGYRTPSSLFYFNSLLYLPYIKYYLFHSSGILILTFANFFLIKNIFINKLNKNNNFIKILSFLIFVFINLVFARVAEYGTDRGGQIIAFILIILFLDLLNKKLINFNILKIITVLILYLITIKSYFIVYSLLFLIIIYNLKKYKMLKLLQKELIFVIISCVFLVSYFISNILNNGCLLYPLPISCFGNFLWSISIDNVRENNIWYELWAKAGATPNYMLPDREEYIKHLNWFPNWVNNYFFTKGSDFVAIIFLILSIIFIIFYIFKNRISKKVKIIKYKSLYLLIVIFFIIWFFKHPDLRYGGYVIVSSLFFIPASIYFSKFIFSNTYKNSIYKYIVVFVLIIFNVKNVVRINSEFKRVDRYQYKDFPFFYVEKVDFTIKNIGNNILFYVPNNNNCWATPFPCIEDYNNMDVKKISIFTIFFKKKV